MVTSQPTQEIMDLRRYLQALQGKYGSEQKVLEKPWLVVVQMHGLTSTVYSCSTKLDAEEVLLTQRQEAKELGENRFVSIFEIVSLSPEPKFRLDFATKTDSYLIQLKT